MRRWWLGHLVLITWIATGVAWSAVVRTPVGALQEQGILTPIFTIVNFSPDNRTILGYEAAEAEEVARGITYKLFLLQLRSDGAVSGVRRYDLDIPSFENAAVTPDGGSVVLITSSGATYKVLDLATGRVRTLMEHRPRTPGFRADPTILWQAGQKLLTLGYFYDEEDYGGVNVIAELDPTKTGVDAFCQTAEIEPVERSMKGLAFHAYTDQRTGFFGVRDARGQKFYRWVAGSPPVLFDEAVSFTGFQAAGDRVAYAADRGNGRHELVLYDGSAGTKRVLGTSDAPLRYVFLSADGSTVVANLIDDPRMRVLAASDRNGWKMVPAPDFPRARVGTIRLTSDGKRMLLYNEDGLQIVDLP